MIARLTGELVYKGADSVIIDVHGVGYLVTISTTTAEALPLQGEAVSLDIHTHVREDAILLFGFRDSQERTAFEALIAMSGMGPKAAMGVLSGIDANDLARAVADEDIARLCMIPGIGKKRAERIILELKDRLDVLASEGQEQPGGGAYADLRSALVNLGYKPADAQRAVDIVRKKAGPDVELDRLLPQALRILRS